MSGNQFIPNFKPSAVHQEDVESPVEAKNDSISTLLYKVAKYSVLVLFALLPVFFTVGLWASLGFDKVMLTVIVSSVVVILSCFMALRKVRVKTVLPISLGFFWLTAIIAFISGYSSGDTLDAIRGSGLEVQTAGFIALLALVMTVTLVFQNSKILTLKSIAVFTISSSLVLLYALLRIVFGADFLALGSFQTVTISPIGGFNDLGILSGMMIVFGLITLSLLPLRTWFKALISAIIFVALFLLTIINFFNIWVVVGFFTLLMLVYLLTRDTLFESTPSPESAENSRLLIVIASIVCVFSAVFIIAGDYAGNAVGKIAKVDYAEVVPSIEGTIGIAKGVYEDSALLGIGPNRFTDAWRLYKDPAINQTIFWDTDFSSGNGFVSTMFINLGLLGGLSFIAFHLLFLYLGYKILLRTISKDSYWYYIGAVSFASSTFIWVMSYVYEPGTAILLIGALFTGLTFVSAGTLLPNTVRTVPLVVNRQRGFFMMAVVIIVITNIIMMSISVSKQYVAQHSFSKVRATAESVEEFERVATEAFILYPDDRFVSLRAQIQLSNLNALLRLNQPTEEDQRKFLTTVEQAQIFIDQALSQDMTNPDNHAVLAGVYSGLAVAGINGARERALSALDDAKKLDPQNPGYYLISAQMAARTGDLELARAEINESLRLKPNYTEALFLSAQIDIKEGNTESAIATTRSIITLEPRNPTRYFQLGMLLSSAKRYQESIVAFEAAVRLDPQYANAKYLLALAYLATDRADDALVQLRQVQVTNPDNPELLKLISQVESGDIESVPDLGLDAPVSEVSPAENDVDNETGKRSEETDLVSPVNTIPSDDSEEQDEVVAEEVVTDEEPVSSEEETEVEPVQ